MPVDYATECPNCGGPMHGYECEDCEHRNSALCDCDWCEELKQETRDDRG